MHFAYLSFQVPDGAVDAISDQDRVTIKTHIVQLMLTAPQAIQAQLSEVDDSKQQQKLAHFLKHRYLFLGSAYCLQSRLSRKMARTSSCKISFGSSK